MTLEKTVELGIILTEKGRSRRLRSESLFPPPSSADKPKK